MSKPTRSEVEGITLHGDAWGSREESLARALLAAWDALEAIAKSTTDLTCICCHANSERAVAALPALDS